MVCYMKLWTLPTSQSMNWGICCSFSLRDHSSFPFTHLVFASKGYDSIKILAAAANFSHYISLSTPLFITMRACSTHSYSLILALTETTRKWTQPFSHNHTKYTRTEPTYSLKLHLHITPAIELLPKNKQHHKQAPKIEARYWNPRKMHNPVPPLQHRSSCPIQNQISEPNKMILKKTLTSNSRNSLII